MGSMWNKSIETTRPNTNLTIVEVEDYTFAEGTLARALEVARERWPGSLATVHAWHFKGPEWVRVGAPTSVHL